MKGLQVTDNDIQVGKDQPYAIDISFEKTASDMCVLVDFGDKDDDSDVFLFSNTSSCPQYPGVSIQGPVTNPMTVAYTYAANGQYKINVTAGNLLHTQSLTLTTTISSAKCKRPTVSIFEQHPHIYDPLTHNRKDSLVMEGAAIFDCDVTVQNLKKWEAMRLDETTGEVLETIDLNVDTVKGAESAVLLLPEQFLGYGLFRLDFTVTMDPSKFPDGDIFASSQFSFVKVLKSSLKASIIAGNARKITRGYGQSIAFQPGLLSEDPDVPEGEPQV